MGCARSRSLLVEFLALVSRGILSHRCGVSEDYTGKVFQPACTTSGRKETVGNGGRGAGGDVDVCLGVSRGQHIPILGRSRYLSHKQGIHTLEGTKDAAGKGEIVSLSVKQGLLTWVG